MGPMLLPALLSAVVGAVSVGAQREGREGIGQAREVLGGGTSARYGPADASFLEDLESQITFEDIAVRNGAFPNTPVASADGGQEGTVLLPLKRGLCPCEVSIFARADGELMCRQRCADQGLARCGCDFIPMSRPMRFLCYEKHCVDEAEYSSPAAPIASVAIFILFTSLLLLFFAAATVQPP